ncbi:MAG: tetratricopeptide repeat protein [Planctomycetaceae bacterium]|nr:tetratricopeptide repeat protein [Planctomycetaceae bacterium]
MAANMNAANAPPANRLIGFVGLTLCPIENSVEKAGSSKTVVAGLAAAVGFDLPGAWCLARVRSALGDDDLSSAVRWLDRARGIGRDDAELAFVTARIERKLGRLDEAGTALERAANLGFDPDAITFEARLISAQSGSMPNVQGELARLLAAGQEVREVAEAFSRGHIAAYRLDDAMGLIEIWQEDFPDDPQPHYLAGRVSEHRSDVERAQKEFRAALAANPEHASSSYNLARVLLAERRPEEALALYEACAEVLFEPLPALIGAVRCLREMGRLDDARSRLERIETPPPERLEIALCIVGDPIEGAFGQLDEEWGRLEAAERHWPAAERRFAAVLEAQPRNWRVRYASATRTPPRCGNRARRRKPPSNCGSTMTPRPLSTAPIGWWTGSARIRRTSRRGI